MKLNVNVVLSLCAASALSFLARPVEAAPAGLNYDNAHLTNQTLNTGMNEMMKYQYSFYVQQQDSKMSGSQNNLGGSAGSSSAQNQRQKNEQIKDKYEFTQEDKVQHVKAKNVFDSKDEGDKGASEWEDKLHQKEYNEQTTKPSSPQEMAALGPGATQAQVAGGSSANYHGISHDVASGADFFDDGSLGGSIFDFGAHIDAWGGGGGNQGNDDNKNKCISGSDRTAGVESGQGGLNSVSGENQKTEPQANQGSEKCNGNQCQGSRGGSAGDDSKCCMKGAFESMKKYLINVANENAGSPCSSRQASKTYANAVWMVQQMYKQCYIPMAVLFLLPGALITNTKTLVSFGILGGKDDDVVSPFTGIMRSIIAIFLIPSTQLATSYVIDVANALEDSVSQYVNLPLIYMWAEEQVQCFEPNQQGKLMKNLPIVPQAPYLGKFAGMPTKGAQLEQLGAMYDALVELANECFHMLTMGLNIISAFQLVMICYLFVMGPISAAFFAWPSVGRDLFRKAFATWLDGTVVLSLWKFWFNVVLLCMTVRLESGNVNPFDIWEVYYLVAFLSIMMVVPFNPFDFKPGEIVTHVLGKAEGVAAKVAQGGKGGGSKGGGKGGGGSGGGGAEGPGGGGPAAMSGG